MGLLSIDHSVQVGRWMLRRSLVEMPEKAFDETDRKQVCMVICLLTIKVSVNENLCVSFNRY